MLFIGAGVLLLAYSVALLFPPEWAAEVKFGWSKLNHVSFAIAVITVVLTLLLSGLQWNDSAMIALPVFAFLSVQSARTDTSLRLVSRYPFNAAIAVLATANGIIQFMRGAEYMLVIMAVFTLMLLAIMQFPGLLSQGDTRALMLIVVGAIPVLPITLLSSTMWLSAGTLIVVLVIIMVINARRNKSGALEALKTKVSIPAVPVFLIPVTAVLAYSMIHV